MLPSIINSLVLFLRDKRKIEDMSIWHVKNCLRLLALGFVFSLSNTANASDSNYTLFLETGIGEYHPSQQTYLGTQIGAGPNNFGFAKPSHDHIYHQTKIGIEYPIKSFKNTIFKSSFEYGSSNYKDNLGFLDPGGNNLLIPGVGVGSSGSGFFLPGPNNQISDAVYTFDYDRYHLETFLEKSFSKNDTFNFKPYLGLSYTEARTKNSFRGNIDFFVREFKYRTDIKIRTVSPIIGFNTDYKIKPRTSLLFGANYAYNFNWGDGTDNLDFTGFGKQTADMDNNDSTHSFSTHLGLNYAINDRFSFGLSTQYQRIGNAPSMKTRDGVSKSDFQYEKADIFAANAVLKYKF